MIDKRYKDGNPLTLRQVRDVKMQAVKMLKLKMPVVRKLIAEWKEKKVITTVRVNKGKKKLQGVGLTENVRKLLETYRHEMDANGRQIGPKGRQLK